MQFVDQNNGWLVGYQGKVLKTSNGGATWNFVTNTGVNPNQRGDGSLLSLIRNMVGYLQRTMPIILLFNIPQMADYLGRHNPLQSEVLLEIMQFFTFTLVMLKMDGLQQMVERSPEYAPVFQAISSNEDQISDFNSYQNFPGSIESNNKNKLAVTSKQLANAKGLRCDWKRSRNIS